MARQQIIEDEFAKLREQITGTVEQGASEITQVTINTSESGVTANPTTYDVKDFTPSKASGLSVAVVVEGTTPLGAGLCKKIAADKYQVIINGSPFLYNSKGEGISANALGTKLRLGENSTSVRGQGNNFTRGQASNKQTVNVLNARDEFAMHILGELLKAVPDPALLSTTEMGYYSKLAYTWAAYMMEEAANGRDNDSGSAVSNYATNTEALLGQIATAIQGIDGTGNNQSSSFNGVVSGTIDIGSTGLGRDASHAIHVNGVGVFPSKSGLGTSAEYFSRSTNAQAAKQINHVLSFNNSGTVGYTSLLELRRAILDTGILGTDGIFSNESYLEDFKQRILGWLYGYNSLGALRGGMMTDIMSAVDSRIQEWLNAARDAENRSLTVNTPT